MLTIGLSDTVNTKRNAGQVYQPWSRPETTHCASLMQNEADAEDLLWTDVHTLLSGEEVTECDPASSSLPTKEKSCLLLPSSPSPPTPPLGIFNRRGLGLSVSPGQTRRETGGKGKEDGVGEPMGTVLSIKS